MFYKTLINLFSLYILQWDFRDEGHFWDIKVKNYWFFFNFIFNIWNLIFQRGFTWPVPNTVFIESSYDSFIFLWIRPLVPEVVWGWWGTSIWKVLVKNLGLRYMEFSISALPHLHSSQLVMPRGCALMWILRFLWPWAGTVFLSQCVFQLFSKWSRCPM